MPIPWIDLRTLQYQEYTETDSANGETVLTWTTVQVFQGTIQPFFPPHLRHSVSYEPEGIVQKVTHICLCNLVASSAVGAPAVVMKYGQRILDPLSGQQYRIEDEQNAGGVFDHYELPLSTLNTQPLPSGD